MAGFGLDPSRGEWGRLSDHNQQPSPEALRFGQWIPRICVPGISGGLRGFTMFARFKSRIVAASAVALMGMGVCTSARADLVQWHVTPGGTSFSGGAVADWVPYGGANPNNTHSQSSGDVNGIYYSIWDQYGPHGDASTGHDHNVYDFGGQQFDVKAMYATNDATNLYVGIVTGFNPDGLTLGAPGHSTTYVPGDLAIDPDWAHNTAAKGVKFKVAPAGSSGTTSLFSGGTWNVPNVAEGYSSPIDTNLHSGGSTVSTNVGYDYEQLNVSYYDDDTDSHVPMYLLDFTIPLSSLGVGFGHQVDLSWGMSCANDYLTVCPTLTRPPCVPLPAADAMYPMGAAIAAYCGRRLSRRRRA